MIIIAICIVIKRSHKRNRIIPSDNVESPPPVPRTLLSAILKVMEVNSIQEENVRDAENIFNIKGTGIYHSSNVNSKNINSGYVQFNEIMREDDESLPINKFVSECLFLDQMTKKDQDQSSISKWAKASQKATDNKIGNIYFL